MTIKERHIFPRRYIYFQAEIYKARFPYEMILEILDLGLVKRFFKGINL